MEWLLRSDFDGLTEVVLWSIAAVVVTTVVLFVYTVGLRVATVASNQRRNKFLLQWRSVFAKAMLDPEAAKDLRLPYVRRADRIDLLEEWNRARSIVDGKAVLDLDYELDFAAEVDMNVVMTGSGQFVEVQGTGEESTFSEQQLTELISLAKNGIKQLTKIQKDNLGRAWPF